MAGMKAYLLRPGHPDDALTLVDRPSPALGPADVRVRIRAVSLNYRDLLIRRNAASRTAPVVPLSDGAGEVVEVGAAVTRWRVGDRVTAAFFPTWTHGELTEADHAGALGGSRDGVLAEEVVLPETAWVPMPTTLSFEQAATLPCAGVTAHQALFEVTRLTPGDRVLVQGSGGVSLFALQLARAAGARVIATTGSPAKAERLRALGADDVLDYRALPAWGAEVRARTGGVDVVVEVGGAGTFDQSVQALRFGGTMSVIGVLAGARGELDLHAMFRKRLRVAGVYVGSVEMATRLARVVDSTRLEPVIDRVFAFDEARAAYAHLASGQHLGKVVVRV